MMSIVQSFCVCVLIACTGVVSAAEQTEQQIHTQLFSPELLMQHREELGLTDEQLARIHSHLDKVQADAAEAQKKLDPVTRKLAELLGAESVDEAAAMKQLEDVFNAEREMKRLHMRVMIRIRNELTAKQQGLAAKFNQERKPDDLQKRLQSKVTRIQQEFQRRAEAGQPPVEAMQLLQSFPEQMQAGRAKEAEAILDRVLKMLDLDQKPVPPLEKRSSRQWPTTSAVLAQVKALEMEDVAWRKIPWKTCLIEGLSASREQNKPVMLWIFIDRPIDDERC